MKTPMSESVVYYKGLKMKLSLQMLLFEIFPSIACIFFMVAGKTEIAMLSGIFATICANQRRTDAAIARLSALQDSNAAGNSTVE